MGLDYFQHYIQGRARVGLLLGSKSKSDQHDILDRFQFSVTSNE